MKNVRQKILINIHFSFSFWCLIYRLVEYIIFIFADSQADFNRI